MAGAADLAVLVLASAVGQFGGIGTSVSRLPFAAGMDGLLPERWRACIRAGERRTFPWLVFGAVASFLLLVAQLGDTLAAAYQELVSLMVIGGFLPYRLHFRQRLEGRQASERALGLDGVGVVILCSVVPPTGL